MSAASNAPMVEVVICTHNNADTLDAVLTALAVQTARANGRWTCLVVDNNCTDHTPDVVRKHMIAGAIPGLRSVPEPEQGLTPARLRGVRSSTAQWIAFVDDDCILQPDWIFQAISFAETQPSTGAFGGRVVLDWAVEPPSYVKSYGYAFAEQDHGSSQKKVPFLAGAGLVVSRLALSACGWTDGPLLADWVGSRLISGGDVEIVLRIAGQGHDLWYVPECTLLHKIPSRRISLRYLIDINRGLGVSQALADVLVWHESGARWIAASGRKVAKGIKSLGSLALSVARRKRALAEFVIQASFRFGEIQGISRILISPSTRRRLMGRAWPAGRRRDRAPTEAA